jgi:streptogramin lyase
VTVLHHAIITTERRRKALMRLWRKCLPRVLPGICAAVCCLPLFTAAAGALGDTDYILDKDGATHLAVPVTHSVAGFWDYFGREGGFLRSPSDLFIARDDTVYIADTGNDRVVRLDADGNFMQSYTANETLSQPQGVYVEQDGDIYIADTGNRRIIHLNPTGDWVEEFTKPMSALLDEDLSFEVTKIGLSRQGYIYTIRGQYFMAIDAQNQFMGFMGANRVGFSLKSLLLRTFASQEQRERLLKERPASYNSFAIGSDGLLYAVTDETQSTGQIQKINVTGQNIYPAKAYGELYYNAHTRQVNHPRFADIAVGREGNVYVAEQYTRRIFVYDPEGRLLGVFGGEGDIKGRFAVPAALDVNSVGDVFVLDQQTGYLHRFVRSAFFTSVTAAVECYGAGDYEEAYNLWNRVLGTDVNYTVANQGLAQCLFKFERFEEAMAYYKKAGDEAGYGSAFSEYRYVLFRKHFGFVILGAAACFVFIPAICILLKKRADKTRRAYFAVGGARGMSLPQKALLMVFHPADATDILKRDFGKRQLWGVPVFLAAAFVMNYICIYFTHYSLGEKTAKEADLLLEATLVVAPLLSWVAAAYALSAITNGESRFAHLLLTSSVALTPYIALTPLVTLFSNLLGYSERSLFGVLRAALLLWVLLLLFLVFRRINDYTFPQAMGIALLSLFAAAVMWGTLLLLFSLTAQLWSFARGVLQEYSKNDS